jgi:membrane-associated phospholipid phosphatase
MTAWGGRWSVDHRVGRKGLWVAVLMLALFVLWTTVARVGITEGSRDSVWIKRSFGAWPSTVKEVAGTSDIQFSLFATYEAAPSAAGPGGPVPTMVGRPTVGTRVDSGDSHNINGSRFVTGIGHRGPVASLSIYIAAPVDRAPNDQFELAVYDDDSGAPHDLLAVSERGTLRADAWNVVAVNVSLEPQTAYWFLFNTNGTTAAANNPVYAAMPAAPLDNMIHTAFPTTEWLETAHRIEQIGEQWSTTLVLVLLAAVVATRRSRQSALVLLAGFGLSLLLALAMRTFLFDPFGGYPSGHALRAGYVTIALAAFIRRRTFDLVGGFLLAVLCAATIYTRGHYAEESIGGLLLAGAAAAAALSFAPISDRARRAREDSHDTGR